MASCQKKKTFPDFDSYAWKQDKLGCTGTRQNLAGNFEKIRSELKGLSQGQILDLLGKPDAQLLYQRNQKFYLYFLEPGLQCQDQLDQSQARTVAIRFSAIELVSGVTYQTGKTL